MPALWQAPVLSMLSVLCLCCNVSCGLSMRQGLAQGRSLMLQLQERVLSFCYETLHAQVKSGGEQQTEGAGGYSCFANKATNTEK